MISQSIGEKISLIQEAGNNIWRESEAAVKFLDNFNLEQKLSSKKIYIGPKNSNKLSWHPHVLWVGIGCERFTNISFLEESLLNSLREFGLEKSSIAGIASIDIKNNEDAILELSIRNKWPIRFFDSLELSSVKVPNPSAFVNREVGTPSVSEASALLAAGQGAKLLAPKRIYKSGAQQIGSVTIAIAQSQFPFAPNKGELHLVGSGPGDLSFLTTDARFALARSTTWLGYSRYLDLLEPLRRKTQVRIDSQLTFELERCKEALNLASQGVKVALISSGDSGIYGMAGLALEMLLELPKLERPTFHIHPGLSAIQLAAARIGSPLMNDFCVISLSDRLTSWTKIEERLKGAAIGDFVVGIYNPRSEERDWQLKKAIEILRDYRSANTPVALARQIGRSEEDIQLFSISDFPIDSVDMLTLVIVGNSLSHLKDKWFLNPRGYLLNE